MKNMDLRDAIALGRMEKLHSMPLARVKQDISDSYSCESEVYFFAANANVVRFLTRCGVKPEKYGNGQTPLFSCRINKINALIDAGYDINAQDVEGRTALLMMVCNRSEQEVSAFLECGADVELSDNKGMRPLCYAKTAKVTQALLQAGANPNACAADGRIPLSFVSEAEQVDLLVQSGADVNKTDNSGKTSLFYAKTSAITKALLKAGANPNSCDLLGQSALFWVSQAEQVYSLACAGAKLNLRDKSGKTALFYAKTSEVAGALLGVGVDVNVQDNDGETVLFKLARSGTLCECSDEYWDDYLEEYLGECSNGAVQTHKLWQMMLTYNPDLNLSNRKGETIFDIVKDENLLAELRQFQKEQVKQHQLEEQKAAVLGVLAQKNPEVLQALSVFYELYETNARHGIRCVAKQLKELKPTFRKENTMC